MNVPAGPAGSPGPTAPLPSRGISHPGLLGPQKAGPCTPGQGQCPQDEARALSQCRPGVVAPSPLVPGLGPTGAKSCTPDVPPRPPPRPKAAQQPPCGVCPLSFSLDVPITLNVMAAPPSHGTPKSPVVGQAPTGDSSSSRLPPLPQLRQVNPKLVTLGLGGDRKGPLGDQGTG